MKLRKSRLVIFISLLLITGFAVTSLASYYVSRASLRTQITRNELPLTSDNIYSEIQRDLLRPIFISSLMASDTFLRDWVLQGEKDESRIVRYLGEIQKKYHTFTSFFVSERTRIYYQSKGILKRVSEDEERDQWYFRVRNLTSDYEINVDPDLANNDSMTIFINYRVYDYQGNFIGAAGVGLTVSAVKDLIRKYQEDYARNIFFIDPEGKIMLHGSETRADISHISQIEGISKVASHVLSQEAGLFLYRRDGRIIHLNTRDIPEFGWKLLVERNEEKTTQGIFNALVINLAICIGITGIVLFLTNLTLASYQRRLERMAATDKLTGIYNRQAFDIILNQALKESRRREVDLSAVLFDIDHFKQINDAHGHLAGDQVLKDIVRVTQATIRQSDILCRWGGEEFMILLKDCSLDKAFEVAEKIREAVSRNPSFFDGQTIFSTISLGVCLCRFTEEEDSLISRVDRLLYQAKQKGRNRSEKEGV